VPERSCASEPRIGALEVRANTEVLAIDTDESAVAAASRRVRTTEGDIETDSVIVCCGV